MLAYGTDGHDVLAGGAGGDELRGIGGNDTLQGGDGADTLYGSDGRDLLEADAGDDLLLGGDGDDTLQGGDGADTLEGDLGDNWLDGGDGIDTAAYGAETNLVVDLAAGVATSDSGVDQLISIENVAGSYRDDRLLGDGGDNIFVFSGGSDQVDGRGGFDILDLRGTDIWYQLTIRLKDTAGQDFGHFGDRVKLKSIEGILGGPSNEKFFGTSGANLLDGASGADYLDGGKGDDTLRGGAWSDTLVGGAGKDKVEGGDGDDVIQIKTWSDAWGDVIDGGQGYDVVRIDHASHRKADLRPLAVNGVEALSAAGLDVAMSAAQFRGFLAMTADRITITNAITRPIRADDRYATRMAIGRIDLADRANTFDMRAIDVGGVGIGEVHGGKVRDVIFGTIADDRLFGGEGGDKLYGGYGDDTLDGGTGADTMKGGYGSDFYRVDSAKDVIHETDGFDVDTVKTSVDYRLGAKLENLILARSVTVHGNSQANVITGSKGSDVIYGEGGNDTIAGGRGDDTIYGGSGDNDIDGGSGNDVIYSGDKNSFSNVVGGKGYDVLYWGGGHLDVDETVEEVHLTGPNGSVNGSDRDDLLIGAANGTNYIGGQSGDDTIIGGSLVDDISGGYGSDLLSGGGGGDRFYFDEFSTTVVDEITDYRSAEGDILDFTALENEAIQAGVTDVNYLGTGAFQGNRGEARIDLHDGYGLFMFDLNGDKISDLTIKLDGVTSSTTIAYLL